MDGDTDAAPLTESIPSFASRWLVLIFPETRDITAYAYAHNAVNLISIDISTDTNAGNDGTWTNAYSGALSNRTDQKAP